MLAYATTLLSKSTFLPSYFMKLWHIKVSEILALLMYDREYLCAWVFLYTLILTHINHSHIYTWEINFSISSLINEKMNWTSRSKILRMRRMIQEDFRFGLCKTNIYFKSIYLNMKWAIGYANHFSVEKSKMVI